MAEFGKLFGCSSQMKDELAVRSRRYQRARIRLFNKDRTSCRSSKRRAVKGKLNPAVGCKNYASLSAKMKAVRALTCNKVIERFDAANLRVSADDLTERL